LTGLLAGVAGFGVKTAISVAATAIINNSAGDCMPSQFTRLT
jgi:hypothetical protein